MWPFVGTRSSDDFQQKLKVIGTARHGTALSQVRLTQGARGAGNMATQRQNIPAGLVSEYPAEVRGRADGAAHVRSYLQWRHARSQGSCSAARGAAGGAAQVVGVAGHAMQPVVGLQVRGEEGDVGLAHDNGTGLAQALNNVRVAFRHMLAESE